MPIYEYACDKCEHEFEVEQRITEDPVKTCPKCRSRRVKKLISRTSFVLKGSGWYSDLYASKGPDKGQEKAQDKDAKKDKSEDSSSDAKPKSDKKDSGGDDKAKSKGKKSSPKAAA